MEMVTRRTPAEWADIVEAFKRSGQTQASFCREHGINEKTLGAHVRGRESVKPMIKRSAEEWRTLITEQRSSGINRNAWCKKKGISPDSMTSAEKRLGVKTQPSLKPEWVEFSPEAEITKLSRQKAAASWGVKIRGGNIEIEVDADYPVEKLVILIERLVKQC
ncbi:MAG: hypothetical protein FWG42_12530 [Clostridiales bacterium]|nr:hypothetical protein [Clostridiales bacterium]